MPPHMHPRSRLTSSLFATTLFASFFVVALPHVLPCPAPRITYADDGTPQQGKRRRRRKCPELEQGGAEALKGEVVEEKESEESSEDGDGERNTGRECPIPKPGGVVGELLGFRERDGKGGQPP